MHRYCAPKGYITGSLSAPSSETHGQSVGSGEKAGRKFSKFCPAFFPDPTYCPWVSEDVSPPQRLPLGTVADPGEGPGGPASPPLFLDQTETSRAENIFFGDGPLPPPLSQGLDPALVYSNENRNNEIVRAWCLFIPPSLQPPNNS